MKYKTYADKLKHPFWQKKRLEIMERDGFQCKKCGDTESPLHVHHLKYYDGNDPWDYQNKYLITLCEHCHDEIEDIKKDNPELNFSKITIYKSDNWIGGNRIMFSSRGDILTMRIFNPDGKYIIGFNFRDDLSHIEKLIKKIKRYTPEKISEPEIDPEL
jgi:hypothetical protein